MTVLEMIAHLQRMPPGATILTSRHSDWAIMEDPPRVVTGVRRTGEDGWVSNLDSHHYRTTASAEDRQRTETFVLMEGG